MSNRILVISAYSIVGVSLLFSLITKDWTWFSRSGSVLTFVAIFLSSRQVIRTAGMRSENPAANPEADFRIDKDASEWGFSFLAVGTLIWGYGDLLGHIIK